MTTTAKIAIAAVIIAALAAVIGYDLMFGKPKSTTSLLLLKTSFWISRTLDPGRST